MGKIRLYELAKELGLENKRVIQLCTELGIEGKKSHSNSLSDDEADKIRRSVIRQAVSGSAAGSKKITIDGKPGLEQRKGNIIRRRRKTDQEPEEAAAPVEAAAEPEEVSPSEEVPTEESPAEVSEPVAVPEEEPAVELEAAVEAQVEESAEESSDVAVEDEQEADLLEETRKKHGARAPKVLGKIDLPTPVVPEKKKETESRSGKPTETGSEAVFAEPSESGGRRDKKKKKGGRAEEGSGSRGSKKLGRKQVLRKADLLDYDNERDAWRSKKDKRKKSKEPSAPTETKASKKVVKISGEMSVGELGRQMGVKVGDLMKVLMNLGMMVNINAVIDFETATLVAEEFGFTTVNTGVDEDEVLKLLRGEDDEAGSEEKVLRPPVVTVMGHVDHGKTSLLDSIRKTSVTTSEHGGITQHIGAYNVKLSSGNSVTFIDTPGHEAFTAMRSRGAQVTDIVVLVVAADDGVMPQTIEAINHSKAAGVPIIVAVNKIDKEDANLDRIKTQLSEHELIPEDWGGTTMMIPVSAITKQGVEELLEYIALQSEIMELKANPKREAYGIVVESQLDKGRGPVVTILVKEGTLKMGDSFLVGHVMGKVRALVDSDGSKIKEAGPGIPVEVLGSSETPDAGSEFFVFTDEAKAKSIADSRAQKSRTKTLASKGGVVHGAPLSLESFSQMVQTGELKELPVIVKADVGGSLEAVKESVVKLSNEEVEIKVIHSGVGAVTENDIQLAKASGSIILGFNVRADSRARDAAETTGVDVRFFTVIYDLVDSIGSALKGMLAPIIKEKTLGRAEVRETFKVPKLGVVAGTYVLDGTIERGSLLRLLRDSRVVHEGKMASLRRFKDDVKEVQSGYECGIGIDGYSDIQNGDIIEAYKLEEERPA